MSVQEHQLVANLVLGPIDRTASNPSISFGAASELGQNSGTGIRGDFNSVSVSISGADALAVSAQGIAMSNDVCMLNGAGVPTDAVTGANYAGKGSLYINRSAGTLWINTNTKASPAWVQLAPVP